VKINGKWHEDNMTQKNKAIFEKLNMPIT